MTTLSYNATTIILPSDMSWENESEFTPIVQSIQHSLDGIAVIEEFNKISGLSIILSGSDSRSWITKLVLGSLWTLSLIPGQVITLTLSDSRSFQVMFDRTDGKPVEFRQLFDLSNTTDDDYFWVKLKFITL